jgi:hypothetical protein
MQRVAQTFLSDKVILEKQVEDLEGALKDAVSASRDNDATQIKLRELESVDERLIACRNPDLADRFQGEEWNYRCRRQEDCGSESCRRQQSAN